MKKPFLALLVLFIILQAEYVDFRDRYNVPIYGVKQVNSVVWITVFRKLREQNNIGWHFGHIRKMGDRKFYQAWKFWCDYYLFRFHKKQFWRNKKIATGDLQATKKPIDQLLINCLFKNCVANQGYIIPLGLNPGKTGSSVIHNLIHIKKKMFCRACLVWSLLCVLTSTKNQVYSKNSSLMSLVPL